MAKDSYASRIAFNTGVQLAGRVASSLISLVTVSLLNAQLHPVGWGQYVAVINYVNFFAILADLGIATLFLREISRYPEDREAITARFFGFRILTAIVMFAVGIGISSLLPVFSLYVLPITLASVAQFTLTINQVFVAVFQQKLTMQWSVLSDVCGRIVTLIGAWVVFNFSGVHNRLDGVLLVIIGGNILTTIISYLVAVRHARFPVRFDVKGWPALMRQVIPMGAFSILGIIHFKADSVILTAFRSVVEVGIYGNAYKIIEVLLTLPAMFIGGIFPNLNQIIIRRDQSLKPFVQKCFDLLLFAAAILILLIIIDAPLIIGMMTRDNIQGASWALRVLALAMVPWFLGSLSGNVVLAANGQKQLGVVQFIAAAINIIANLILIPRYGYHAAAWTTFTTESIAAVGNFWLAYKLLNFRPDWYLLRTISPTLIILLGGFELYSHRYGDIAYSLALRGRVVGFMYLCLISAFLCIAYVVPFLLNRTLPEVLQTRLPHWLGGVGQINNSQE